MFDNGGMLEALDTLTDLKDRLSALVPGASDELVAGAVTDGELVGVLQVLGDVSRQVDALIVASTVQAQSASTGGHDEKLTTRLGCANVGDLLRRTTRCDKKQAGVWTAAAAAFPHEVSLTSGEPLPGAFPAMRAAMRDGAVSAAGVVAATARLRAASARIDPAGMHLADRVLAAAARGIRSDDLDEHGEPVTDAPAEHPPMDAWELRTLADALVDRLDQDGAAPSEERALRDRGLWLGARGRDGLIPVRGDLLPEVAGQLQTLIDAVLNPHGPERAPGPRFTDDAAERSDEEPAVHDDRTVSQRQHDAFAVALGIAARAADAPTIGGAAPTLVVSVSAEDFAAGRAAHIDGIGAVPVAVAHQVACGGTVQRVVHDPRGKIIDLGFSGRIFSAAQRRAIIARDGSCIIPGCPVPARWCEVHHVDEHARGGPTHVDNGVPLCFFHHRTLERSGWEIVMRDGVPHVRGPAWWDPQRRFRPASKAPGHAAPGHAAPSRSPRRGSPARARADSG